MNTTNHVDQFEIFKTKKRGRKSQRPSKNTLFAYRKTHDVQETAKHFNVSRVTIYRWTNYYLKELTNNNDD